MIVGVHAGDGGRFVDLIAGGAYPDWCNRCMSSSAVRVRFYVLSADGPRMVGLWWACGRCDPEQFNDDDGRDGDVPVPA